MPRLLEGEAPAGLWAGLAAQIAAEGFELQDAVDASSIWGANGVTIYDTKVVKVRADMDDAARVKTLAHELGHVLALRLSAGDAPALFLARTGSGRVIRGALPRRAEVAVVVAGPLAPLAVVGVWAIVSPRPLLAFAFGIVLAISHALLLLVPSSDRAALLDAFREPADHH